MCLPFLCCSCSGIHHLHDDSYYFTPYREPSVFEKIDMAMGLTERISRRISVLLEEEGLARRVTDDRVRRCLAFLRMELSASMAALRSCTPSDDLVWRSWWLRELENASLWVDRVYDMDLPRPTLLRRAAQRCRCSRRSYEDYNNGITDAVATSYKLFQDYRYKLQFVHPSSDLVGPPLHEVEDEATGFHLVGIDSPAKKLIRWITAIDENLRVISIVGPAGMGKTTLAMELHRRLNGQADGSPYFQCCAIAKVSWVPDVKKLLQDIYSQVLGSSAPPQLPQQSEAQVHKDVQELVRSISEHLQDKRYFILLDEIWVVTHWKKIKAALPSNKCGSRILVTTCLTSIAQSCCSDYDDLVHEMEPLNKLDSERLLLTKAFDKDSHLPDNVKLLCDEILRRCEGIPLFITGMADWLKNEQWLLQQQEVKQSSTLLVEQVPQLLKSFKQALSPIYNDLPYELKLLLIYMTSIFPQGYLFKKDHVIRKWLLHEELTHSLDIEDKDEEEMEDHFSQLVDRNIITPVAANWRYNDKPDEAEVCQWKINHYMWQFLASISSEKGFGFTSCTLTSTTPAVAGDGDVSQTPRWLAVHHPDPMLSALLTMDLSQTRSLVMSGTVDLIPLDKFLYLVVLDLEGWDNLKDENMLEICSSKMYVLLHLSIRKTHVSRLPIQITELCSLRTLDASHTNITELPTQIKDLCKLRTLDLSHTQIEELPTQIKDLCSLKTLDVSNTRITKLPTQIKELRSLRTLAVSRTSITDLPLEVYMLENLRRLDLRNTRIKRLPEHEHITRGLEHILVGGDEMAVKILERMIQHSENLMALATIDLNEYPASSVKALGDLIHLRVLAITWSIHQCTDRDYCEALRSSITKWSKLKSLTIHCGFSCSMDFLGTLPSLPLELEKFKVTAGRFSRVPEWISMLNRLFYVQISVCKLETDDLKKLRGLPRLQCLVLGLEFIPREEIVIGNEGFRQLLRVSVDCPVPWLNFKQGAMQKLAYLELKVCSGPASREGVAPSGLRNLQSLSEVVLQYNQKWCSDSTSVKKTVEAVKKEVAQHSNPIHLLINGTRHDVQNVDVWIQRCQENLGVN
ncbi:unnamed protein product [Urochloa decumbens]|uniref:AAA+ ATPase domain-containing protein n=2 Tax=Urochloa decumbens TaxID=240449 RepID=A0ABC9ATF7_9POAL